MASQESNKPNRYQRRLFGSFFGACGASVLLEPVGIFLWEPSEAPARRRLPRWRRSGAVVNPAPAAKTAPGACCFWPLVFLCFWWQAPSPKSTAHIAPDTKIPRLPDFKRQPKLVRPKAPAKLQI